MISKSRRVCLLVFIIKSTISLILCPYTKVEESFGLQASHDLYYEGITPLWFVTLDKWGYGSYQDSAVSQDVSNRYDHLQFPGVVPRSSLGPLMLSTLSRLIGIIVSSTKETSSIDPKHVQFLVRFFLLLLNTYALARLAYHSEKVLNNDQKDPSLGNYFLLICACQFHIPFYCSRTLPNIFSMVMVTHAFADWFQGCTRKNTSSYYFYRSAAWIVSTIVLFRCDMIILLFTVGLSMLFQRQMTVANAVLTGVISGACSLMLTVLVDSVFWQRFLWPEGEVLFFNTIENKSSEWGVMPWYWYWTSALPKAMVLTILLVPFSFLRIPEWLLGFVDLMTTKERKNQTVLSLPPLLINNDSCSILPFLVPVFAFVGLYSFLPHKEVRFLFPALSMFNIAAAHGLSHLHKLSFTSPKSKKESDRNSEKESGRSNQMKRIHLLTAKCLYACGAGTLLLTMIASLIFLSVSYHNYPGGEALHMLKTYIEKHPKVKSNTPVNVHIDVSSSMSGVSLFGQRTATLNPSLKGEWTFEKGGFEDENDGTRMLSSKKDSFYTHLLSEEKIIDGFHVINVAQGFPKVSMRKFKIETTDAIFVLEKDGW